MAERKKENIPKVLVSFCTAHPVMSGYENCNDLEMTSKGIKLMKLSTLLYIVSKQLKADRAGFGAVLSSPAATLSTGFSSSKFIRSITIN